MAELSSNTTIPSDLFEPTSFATLSGSVVITWVATSAIVSLWGGIDLKLLGFILSMIVALVGYIVSKNRSLRTLVIVPFNGLLIYLTVVGGTTFLPTYTPTASNDASPITPTDTVAKAIPDDTDPVKSVSPFFRAWNPNEALIKETKQLSSEKQQLLQTNQRYEAKLDSTRRIIQKIPISSEIKSRLMKSMEVNRNVNFQPVINQ